jgi:hypothetical protein
MVNYHLAGKPSGPPGSSLLSVSATESSASEWKYRGRIFAKEEPKAVRWSDDSFSSRESVEKAANVSFKDSFHFVSDTKMQAQLIENKGLSGRGAEI